MLGQQYVAVGLSDVKTCCLLTERVFLLGADEQGALGCGLAYANLTSTATPRLVSNLTNASAIFCGALFNCALLKSGTLLITALFFLF
jgi:hypothetical protein